MSLIYERIQEEKLKIELNNYLQQKDTIKLSIRKCQYFFTFDFVVFFFYVMKSNKFSLHHYLLKKANRWFGHS